MKSPARQAPRTAVGGRGTAERAEDEMRRTIRRVAVAMMVASLAGFFAVIPLVLAYAQEAQVAEDVLMQDEAWFFRYRQPLAPVPSPDDPTGNELPAIAKAEVRNRSNVYANAEPESLHVGINLGEEEAIMALGLPLIELGGGLPPVVTGGTITLVDAGSDFGSRNAGSAEMVACLVTEFWVSAIGGDWEDQPDYDCAVRSTVVLEEGSDPLTWTVDLAPFVSSWADPAVNYGVAIVPDPDSAASPPEQTWHVAFQNNFYRQDEPTDPEPRPITATVRYVPQELPSFDLDDSSFEDFSTDSGSQGFTSGSTDTFDSGSFDAGDTGFEDTPVDMEETPVFEPSAPADTPSSPLASDGPTPIRTNPAVYLLPFLGLGLAGLLGYSLSQDPELPAAREGAVSKLMRQRRSGLH